MTELMAYINSTPGLDISDQIATDLPHRLVDIYGNRVYMFLEAELLETHSPEEREKLCIFTEELSR